jgi:cytochrome P450
MTLSFIDEYDLERLPSSNNDRCPFGAEYRPHLSPLLENPYPFYARARREEPIFYSEVLQMWVVTRYEDIRTILLQPNIFSSKDTLRPITPFSAEVIRVLQQEGYPRVDNPVNSDGQIHKRLRSHLNKALSPSRIAAMEPTTTAIANKLVDGFINDGHADFITQFAYPLPLEVLLLLIGVPQKDMQQVKRWCDDRIALFSTPLSEERQIACAHSLAAFHKYCMMILQDRLERPREDVATDLLLAQQSEEHPASLVELGARLAGLVMAGHETTTNLLGNMMPLLLSQRDRWEKLLAHPELIPQTVEESLRCEPPAQAFIRTATREATVAGKTFPEGTMLLLAYGSGNHDEGQFPDAESFDVERTPNRHLGFGHGVHFCVGAPLARLEGRIALKTLTERLPTIRLVSDQQYEYVPSMISRGLKHLALAWELK